MKGEKKELKNYLQINNNREYTHSYYSKIVYMHIFTPTDVGTFWAKMCIYDNFFYFRLANMSALKATTLIRVFPIFKY